MFSAQKSQGTYGGRTHPRVLFDAPPRRTLLLPMPCGIRVERLALKFPLSGYFKVIQGVSTCFKGFSARIFFIGSLAPGNLRSSAPSLRTPLLFGIGSFSGAWTLALGAFLPCPCEGLIRVENGLVRILHRPKNRPENKGLQTDYKPSQTKKFCHGWPSARTGPDAVKSNLSQSKSHQVAVSPTFLRNNIFYFYAATALRRHVAFRKEWPPCNGWQ
jgi:hypothetical protein